MWHVLDRDQLVGITSFVLLSQSVHGLKVTSLWQMSSFSSLYQE